MKKSPSKRLKNPRPPRRSKSCGHSRLEKERAESARADTDSNMQDITETISAGKKAAQQNLDRFYEDGEAYVRSNPAKAALVAMGAGFLLAQLPLRWMIVAIIKLTLLLVKPATFIYAISKLVDDVRSSPSE